MTRRGWTLHEMLISLGVTSGVIAIAAHAATAQLRFFADGGERAAVRTQLAHASSIAASMLWSISVAGGDIVVAQDSAIEVHLPIGASFVCASSPGVVTLPAATERGNTLASFSEEPSPGDRLLALFEDSLGATWLALRANSASLGGTGCSLFPAVSETRTLVFREQLTVPAGAALRFTRPVRLSLYRGSDSRWYLGSRTWNAETQAFNAVQPVAGPLNPYSTDAGRSGLRFVYRDSDGLELPSPVEGIRVASLDIVARSTTARFADSIAVTVGLRNAR